MRYTTVLFFGLLLSCTPPTEKKIDAVEKSMEVVQLPALTEKEVVCFVYHRFGDSRFPSTNVSVEDFESHLSWLAQHHYQILTLSQAIEYMKSDEEAKRTAVISIDDGYKSFFENGLPLLIKYNMPATLFINTETVGAGDYMDWEELREASGKSIEIGNHTNSHAYFLNEKPTVRNINLLNDIQSSQLIIEHNLKITPTVFAYPYGEFDKAMKSIVEATGFRGAAAQNSGVMNSTTDVYQIPRFPMSESYAKMFEAKALMRSFTVIKKSPEQSLLPKGRGKPILTLTVDTKDIRTDQMQCFVQGSSCELNIVKKDNSQISLTLQATTSILGRRRTLYTLTAPDSSGNWHWFSHLWVNPSVK